MHNINLKSNTCFISTFDFTTLYTKIEHDNLLEVLNDIIDLEFNGGKTRQLHMTTRKHFGQQSVEKRHSQRRN